VLGIGKHGDKDLGIFGNLADLVSEGDVMFFGLEGFALVDVEAVDLVALVGEVDGHREPHVAQSDEPDLREGVELPCNELH
jgi:hypothetical protein